MNIQVSDPEALQSLPVFTEAEYRYTGDSAN